MFLAKQCCLGTERALIKLRNRSVNFIKPLKEVQLKCFGDGELNHIVSLFRFAPFLIQFLFQYPNIYT